MRLRGGAGWGRRCAQGSTPPLPLAPPPAAWRAPMHFPEEAQQAAAPALASGSRRATAARPPRAPERLAAPMRPPAHPRLRRYGAPLLLPAAAGLLLAVTPSSAASGRASSWGAAGRSLPAGGGRGCRRRARAPLRRGRGLSPRRWDRGREGGSDRSPPRQAVRGCSGAPEPLPLPARIPRLRLTPPPSTARPSPRGGQAQPPPAARASVPLLPGEGKEREGKARAGPGRKDPRRAAPCPYSAPRTPPHAAAPLLLAAAPARSASILRPGSFK